MSEFKHALAALVLVSLAGGVAAASEDDAAIRDLAAEARLPPATRGALDAELRAAQHDGVPAALLFDRVEEGLAKGAAAGEIESLVRSEHTTFAQAARLLRDAAPAAVKGAGSRSAIEAVGEALSAGVEAKHLGTLLAEPSRARGNVPPLAEEVRARAEALAGLAERGFPSSGSVELLASAVQRGHERQALRAVSGAAERLDREGRGPREPLLGRLHDELSRGRSPGELYGAVAAALPRSSQPEKKLKRLDRGPDRDAAFSHAPGK